MVNQSDAFLAEAVSTLENLIIQKGDDFQLPLTRLARLIQDRRLHLREHLESYDSALELARMYHRKFAVAADAVVLIDHNMFSAERQDSDQEEGEGDTDQPPPPVPAEHEF